MRARILLLPALMLLFIVASAAPALAHGGGSADATNFLSKVTGVTEGDGSGETAAAAEVPGVDWRVRALDSYLEVTNIAAAELTVPGYENEPYLRIGRDGVFENRNSPAVYLNNDRFAETPVPANVSGSAEPDWVRVGDGPTYRWHDHRIHWMAQTLPPQAKLEPDKSHVIQKWVVPFEVGGEQFAVRGDLRWIPADPWWPWPVGAGVLLMLPVVVAFFTSQGKRRRTLIRVGAVIVAVIAVADIVHALDDVFAVPATLSENLYALAQSIGFVLIGLFGAHRGWRGGEGSPTALAIGAGALFVGVGLTHTSSLAASQIASVLPPEATRAVIAANLALLLPIGVALAYELRAHRREHPIERQPHPEPASETDGRTPLIEGDLK